MKTFLMVLAAAILGTQQVLAELTLSHEPEAPPAKPESVAKQPPEPEPLRLNITLNDGSRIIGVPAITTLPLKTSFADMEIPLERIRSAALSGDPAATVLLLTNGDRVTAAPVIKEFQLTTLFGKVKISLSEISALSVIQGGSGLWPRDGLWGYWPLDGDAKDASGNRRDGEIKGATLTEGVKGRAYYFAGNETIVLGNPDFEREEYTISGWIRTERPAQKEVWRSWIDNLCKAGGAVEIFLGDGRQEGVADGVGYIIWNARHDGVAAINAPKFNMRDGKWHHCAVTYRKGAQKLFVDGKVAGEYAYSGPLPSSSNPIAIGGHSFEAYHRPWIGDVDEVFIYLRALSEDEVHMLYRCVPGAR